MDDQQPRFTCHKIHEADSSNISLFAQSSLAEEGKGYCSLNLGSEESSEKGKRTCAHVLIRNKNKTMAILVTMLMTERAGGDLRSLAARQRGTRGTKGTNCLPQHPSTHSRVPSRGLPREARTYEPTGDSAPRENDSVQASGTQIKGTVG